VDPHECEGKNEDKQENNSSSVLDAKSAQATNPHDNFHDIPCIVIGDSAGTVRIVSFPPVFADTLDTGAKKHNKELWKETVGAEEEGVYVMKRLHDDVVRDVRYISDLRMLVTCSNDGLVKLVDIFKHTVREEYSGHSKQDDLAIRAQWCAGGNYLATSGKRQLYLWDPFTLETLNVVKDFSATIVSHFIDDSAGTLIIGTLDKRITVLDTIDYTIMQSFVDTTTYRPNNELSTLMYLPQSRTLFTAGNGLTRWVTQPIKSVDGGDEWDDSEAVDDVLTCLQNVTFKLSIVVTTTGIVSAYNTEDGTMMNCFSLCVAASDDDGGGVAAVEPKIFDPVTGLLQPLVQHALLDSRDRHLIIITRSNAVQYWNFQSGTCVGTIQPAVPNQLTALANQPFTITCATTMLLRGDSPVQSSENAPSSPGEVAPRRLLMLGTSLSYAVGYIDSVEELSVDPVSCLSNISTPVDRGGGGGAMGTSSMEQHDPFVSQTSEGGGTGMRDDSMQSASEHIMMTGTLDMAVVSAGRASVTSLVAIDDSSGLLAVAYSNGTCSIWNVVSFRRVVVLDMTAFSMQLDGLLRSARRSVFDIAVKQDDIKKDVPVQRRAAPARPAPNTGLGGSHLDRASFIMPHGVPTLPRVASSRNGMKKTKQSKKKRKGMHGSQLAISFFSTYAVYASSLPPQTHTPLTSLRTHAPPHPCPSYRRDPRRAPTKLATGQLSGRRLAAVSLYPGLLYC
jgi:WD40 repeat protein